MICAVQRPRRKREIEHQHQKALARWAMFSGRFKYPELELLAAIPNGGQRHPAVAAKLKAEGVKAGFPDLILPVARHGHHGLFIEMKAPDGTVQATQTWWHERLRDQGYYVAVAWDWEEAKRVIEWYLGETSP